MQPFLGRPPPSRMWDPRPCHPLCVAILGLPCPILVRSGPPEKVFQAAPARSIFLPPPEGGMREAYELGALVSAQGWPTCSHGWMALDVSHSAGWQASPSPAMPPLRKYRGSFVPIATSSLSHPCHSWWLHWLGHRDQSPKQATSLLRTRFPHPGNAWGGQPLLAPDSPPYVGTAPWGQTGCPV